MRAVASLGDVAILVVRVRRDPTVWILLADRLAQGVPNDCCGVPEGVGNPSRPAKRIVGVLGHGGSRTGGALGLGAEKVAKHVEGVRLPVAAFVDGGNRELVLSTRFGIDLVRRRRLASVGVAVSDWTAFRVVLQGLPSGRRRIGAEVR